MTKEQNYTAEDQALLAVARKWSNNFDESNVPKSLALWKAIEQYSDADFSKYSTEEEAIIMNNMIDYLIEYEDMSTGPITEIYFEDVFLG